MQTPDHLDYHSTTRRRFLKHASAAALSLLAVEAARQELSALETADYYAVLVIDYSQPWALEESLPSSPVTVNGHVIRHKIQLVYICPTTPSLPDTSAAASKILSVGVFAMQLTSIDGGAYNVVRTTGTASINFIGENEIYPFSGPIKVDATGAGTITSGPLSFGVQLRGIEDGFNGYFSLQAIAVLSGGAAIGFNNDEYYLVGDPLPPLLVEDSFTHIAYVALGPKVASMSIARIVE